MSEKNETYLGDGLYASYNGYAVKLRAPRLEGDHYVTLDSSVLEKFETFVAKLTERGEI